MGKKFTILLTAQHTGKMENLDLVIQKPDKSGNLREYKVLLGNISNRDNDPGWWYMQAYDFASTFRWLLELINSDSTKFYSSINPAVYIWSISAELYMKTFLLKQGDRLEEVVGLKHDLESLRLRCFNIDKDFEQSDLTFLTKNQGPLITFNGGMRYPQKSGTGFLYQPQMPDSLDFLEEKVRPLVTELIT